MSCLADSKLTKNIYKVVMEVTSHGKICRAFLPQSQTLRGAKYLPNNYIRKTFVAASLLFGLVVPPIATLSVQPFPIQPASQTKTEFPTLIRHVYHISAMDNAISLTIFTHPSA